MIWYYTDLVCPEMINSALVFQEDIKFYWNYSLQ